MRDIVVGFSKSNKIGSRIIRAFQGSDFSHVYLKFYAKSFDRFLVYQASGLKVNFEGLGSFDSHSEVVKEFKIELSEEAYVKLMQFCIDNCGAKYSLRQLVGMSWVLVNRRLGKTVNNPLAEHDAYICSELAAAALNLVYPEKFKNLESVSPVDLYTEVCKWE